MAASFLLAALAAASIAADCGSLASQTSLTSPASQTSLASPTSPTSQTILASPTSLTSLTSPATPTIPTTLTITVANPTDVPRRDIPVVIDLRATLGDARAAVRSAQVSTPLPTREGQGGGSGPAAPLPSQLDDLDGDLVPDELCFVCDVPAASALTLSVAFSAAESQSLFPPRVCAFMKVWDRKYRYPRINSIEYQGSNPPLATYDAIYGHGAQWESELVGFRVYMDHRQSIDIYGKPRPALTLDRTNFYSTREDMAAGLGCDILFAGASVGAGSFRGYVEGQPTYVDSVEARGQRVIASGPVRTIVEVTDRGWWYEGQTLQMRQLYTMYAGHRDVQVDIALRGLDRDGQKAPLLFCTGVQKLETANEGFLQADGLAGSWGLNVPDKAAEDLVEGVGLGVYAPASNLASVKEDSLNYLTILSPDDEGRIRYHLAICALMEEGGFRTSTQWFEWLRCWRRDLDTPCTVTVAPRR